ncbi:MAG: S8 family serine peptidase [Prolixibacteraceae bacterium]
MAFTDKNNSPYSLSQPEEYLSERAIQRRIKQRIPMDSLDLPVNSTYINQVLDLDAEFIHASKWLNGVTVQALTDSFEIEVLQLPFVSYVQMTKPAETTKSVAGKFKITEYENDEVPEPDSSFYGLSAKQIAQLNGHYLHEQSYFGQGIQIAVLDAGFLKVDTFVAFDSLRANNRISGTRDFVNPEADFYETHYHGMSVLSCMAGYIPGMLIGAAPEASYWLLRSEDAASEYIIEEDNWVVAAEFADSAGADVINSSLGYFTFDDESMNHTYTDMDGNTTRITIGADIAASRGMLVFTSAGNEGNDSWKYIIAPADGDEVIAVGAVDGIGDPAAFTSYGPAADGDVKPNIAAMGRNTFLQKSDGTLGYASGTSFAAPIMAGFGACLWQANPKATAAEIKFAIEQSAHLYPFADSLMGYGIPDMKLADDILKSSFVPYRQNQQNWLVYPNPVQNFLVLQNQSPNFHKEMIVSFYSADGSLLRKEYKTGGPKIILNNLFALPAGFLILKIETDGKTETVKLSKIR